MRILTSAAAAPAGRMIGVLVHRNAHWAGAGRASGQARRPVAAGRRVLHLRDGVHVGLRVESGRKLFLNLSDIEKTSAAFRGFHSKLRRLWQQKSLAMKSPLLFSFGTSGYYPHRSHGCGCGYYHGSVLPALPTIFSRRDLFT